MTSQTDLFYLNLFPGSIVSIIPTTVLVLTNAAVQTMDSVSTQLFLCLPRKVPDETVPNWTRAPICSLHQEKSEFRMEIVLPPRYSVGLLAVGPQPVHVLGHYKRFGPNDSASGTIVTRSMSTASDQSSTNNSQSGSKRSNTDYENIEEAAVKRPKTVKGKGRADVSLPIEESEQIIVEQGASSPAQSRLQWQDTTIGSGRLVEPDFMTTMSWKGKLGNGTLLGADVLKSMTVDFNEKSLVKGWLIGMQGMKEGGSRIITIPPELGYGSKGASGIPPDATLIITCRLDKVEKPSKPGPEQTDE